MNKQLDIDTFVRQEDNKVEVYRVASYGGEVPLDNYNFSSVEEAIEFFDDFSSKEEQLESEFRQERFKQRLRKNN